MRRIVLLLTTAVVMVVISAVYAGAAFAVDTIYVRGDACFHAPVQAPLEGGSGSMTKCHVEPPGISP